MAAIDLKRDDIAEDGDKGQKKHEKFLELLNTLICVSHVLIVSGNPLFPRKHGQINGSG